MTRLFLQNPDELKNFPKGRRFVFGVGDAKEKPEQAAVPEVEKFENRKQQARGEIDSIYESGKYDTYNFRTLPQEFKDHMRNNFGQWIDSNVAKYDKDKDSGINAAEYEEFKKMLNGKVSEILDRLIESKEKKKQQAIENKETAEQAKEAQERLEGVDTSKLNEANLENEDGCYTELLSYQKDFEKEASGFAALAGVFSGAKEKADHANKSHHTGATAFGEMLYNWYEDIPEVKDAKAAKAQAVADFRAKLAEMKKRQKARQARGNTLNGAPEKIRGKVTSEYDEAKKKTREDLDLAKKAEEENRLEKELLQKEMEENEKRRKIAQREYEMIVSRLREAEQRKAEVEKRTGEMREAVTGFERTAEEARKRRGETGAAPGMQTPPAPGTLTPAEIERQAGDAAQKAREAAGELETGLGEADKVVGGMSGNAMRLQRQVADMLAARKLMSSDLDKRGKTEELLTDAVSGLTDNLEKLGTEQTRRLEQVDMLDSAIAETVIQVDTSNFELVKQGENYLNSLQSMDVSGPGFLDTAGAMVMGIPGAESAYNWSGDKLSGAWQWAKGAPVLGAAIEIAGYAGDGWVAAWDVIGDGLSWVGDKMHLGEAWDWMSDATKHMSPKFSSSSPLLDTIVNLTAGEGLGVIIEVFAGVTEGAKGLVQGVGMMLQHPFETIRGLGGLLNHPGKIIDALIQKDKWSTESTSKIIGRAIFDVIATLTGGGATATSVKTAITAMKLGGKGLFRGILMGLKTFPGAFASDIGKMIVGMLKFPGKTLGGLADLFKWMARRGKRLEPVKGAGALNTGRIAREAEALSALDAARNNPAEFVKWLQKYPDQVDFAYRLVKKEKAAAKKAAQEARRTKEAKKKKSGEERPADESVKREEPAKREEITTKREEESASVKKEEPVQLSGEQGVARSDERTKPAHREGRQNKEDVLKRRAERAEMREISSKNARERLSSAERALLDRTPDYKAKPLTVERAKLNFELQEKIRRSEVFSAMNKKFRESLDELKRVHAEELQTIKPNSPENKAKIKAMKRRHFNEQSRLDVNRLMEALPQDELEMLARSFDRLDDTIMSRVLSQEYMMVLDAYGKPLRVYIGNPINNGSFGMVHDCAFVKGTDRVIQTGGAIKRPRDNASLRADKEIKEYDTARMNEHLVAMEVSIGNEVRTFKAIRDFEHRDGLLRPRAISSEINNPFVIYDKIDAGPGEGVRLKDRIRAGDKVEDLLGYSADAMTGEFNLAKEGWYNLDIKPENIFVGRRSATDTALQGVMGDLSLNNLDDVPAIHMQPLPGGAAKAGPSSKKYGVFKMNYTDRSRSLLIGVTEDYFSFEHVNKSFQWVKDNPGKAVPESIMALPGNNAFAVTLERIFKKAEDLKVKEDGKTKIMADGKPETITVYREFDPDVLPVINRSAIVSELDALIIRLKNPDSGIDITTRQAEFRRIQKMIAEARKQDEALEAFRAAG